MKLTVISIVSSIIFSLLSLYFSYQNKKIKDREVAHNFNFYVDIYSIDKINGKDCVQLVINNSSFYPVYDVLMISAQNNNTLSNPNINPSNIQYHNIVFPGTYTEWIEYEGCGAGGFQTCIGIFRDNNNQYWEKLQDGQIKAISNKERDKFLEKYQIFPPFPNSVLYKY